MNETNKSTWDGSGEGWVRQQGGNEMYANEAREDGLGAAKHYRLITEAERKIAEITATREHCKDTLTDEQRTQMEKDIEAHQSILAESTVELKDYMLNVPGSEDADDEAGVGEVLH